LILEETNPLSTSYVPSDDFPALAKEEPTKQKSITIYKMYLGSSDSVI
jgi:hypothetical protein